MYNHTQTEKKWQKFWEENQTFRIGNDFSKPKYYCLDMFPYPSGAGLHVGHPEGMTANDIVARYKHAKGYNVLHPMGWDAFGLPAENYAIKTGTHPRITTDQNIDNFRRQIKELGFSYDWSREIDTTDPKYYKWTQWIFLKLFEKGLAYEQDLPINYCPSCKTGLANEEVLNDFTCERCGTKVEKRKIKQWVLAITKYADRLLADVDRLDWPESIKEMQRNWIGKSEGCEFEMKVVNHCNGSLLENLSISVYTTRIDTVFGMTYAVLAPDHKDVLKFITEEQKEVCLEYIENSKKKSDQDRTADNKEKTGVFTGSYAINPFNNEKVPLFIGDYVLGNYGTGAVMAVPAHDERDFEFANKYNLEIKQSIAPYIKLDGKSTPRSDENVEKEHTATAIIKHWEDNIYAILEFGIGEHGFVGGCKEEFETKEECIIREVGEEIGYSKMEIKEIIFEEAYGRGFKERKNSERESNDKVFYIELKNGEKCNFGKDEGIKDVKWLSIKELKEIKLLTHHKVFLEQHLKENKAFTEYGVLCNSSEFDGLTSEEAKVQLTEFAEKNNFGKKKVNYKLRDWLFSRQRYWGEPIPLIHLDIEDLKKLPHIDDISKATDPKLAYILKRTPVDGESNSDASTCSGKVRELVINGNIFSKIYDGIYTKIVCDYNLPLELPQVQNYEPSGDGSSPLSKVPSFVDITLASNLKGKRETNTMPQWGGSCWYYLRYMDSDNAQELVNKDIVNYWGEVDSYVGGAEHAVLHLLYARFWHKFLFDIGVVPTNEPFGRLRNQGLILAHAFERKNGGLLANDLVEEKDGKYFEIETGEEVNRIVSKMSKSLKNVVNPDEIVKEFGADSLRLYEMYMADFKDSAPWDSKGIIGVRRFLEKVERAFSSSPHPNPLPQGEGTGKICENDDEAIKLLHKTIKKIEEDIANYKFNTAIAAMMILVNYGRPANKEKFEQWKKYFAIILHPFAPHLSEELWENYCDSKNSIFFAPWPEYDENLVKDDIITIGVQVLGKLRGTIEIGVDEDEKIVLQKAKSEQNVARWLEGKELVKEIYVKGKIVNLVVKMEKVEKTENFEKDLSDKKDNIMTENKVYEKTNFKFVAVLNKKVVPGKIMNALAHMTAGLVGKSNNIPDMGIINYEDKDNSPHYASKHPYIILKADNSNKIRALRQQLIEQNIEFSSFTHSMTIGSYEEQMEATKKQGFEDLEYYGICFFGKKEVLDELTKKFSMYN